MRFAHVLLALVLVAAACSGDDAETVTDGGASGAADASSEDSSGESSDGSAADDADADATESEASSPDESADAEEDTVTSTTTDPADDDEAEAESPTTSLQLNPTTTKAAPATSGPVGSARALYAGSVDPGLSGFADIAVADLAGRLGVDASEIDVASAVLVTWADSAIGCPLPGMEYLQAQQDGSLIELGHDGTYYRYHSGGDQATPLLCPANRATDPS